MTLETARENIGRKVIYRGPGKNYDNKTATITMVAGPSVVILRSGNPPMVTGPGHLELVDLS